MSSKIKTQVHFCSIFGVNINFRIKLKKFEWAFLMFCFGNNDLQLFAATGYSFWIWIWIWICGTVMLHSLGNQSDASVTKPSQYDLGKCGLNWLLYCHLTNIRSLMSLVKMVNILSLFPKHFSIEMLLPSAYPFMVKWNGGVSWVNYPRSRRMSSLEMNLWIMGTLGESKFYELIWIVQFQQLWVHGIVSSLFLVKWVPGYSMVTCTHLGVRWPDCISLVTRVTTTVTSQ